jgi:hypothetical protein
MRTGIWISLVVCIVGIVILTIVTPPATSWERSYRPTGTQPFDQYAIVEALKRICYGKVSIAYGNVDTALASVSKKATIFVVTGTHGFSDEEENELLAHAVDGGTVILMVRRTSDRLDSLLGIRSHYVFNHDTSTISIGDRTFNTDSVQHIRPVDIVFTSDTVELRTHTMFDTASAAVSMSIGEGRIVVVGCSDLLTNYGILNKTTGPVSRALLVSMVPPMEDILWYLNADVYNAQGSMGATSGFDIVKYYPSLRWALIVPLVAFVLYMANGIRHRQRPIPSLPVDVNTSVDFISTLADLYAVKGGSTAILALMMRNLRWHAYQHYRIHNDNDDEAFFQSLARVSSITDREITVLRAAMAAARADSVVDDITLVETARAYHDFISRIRQ